MSNIASVLGRTFDANQVDPSNSFEPIPKGKYLVIITESEIKSTKAGDGQYLQLVHEIVDGQYKGRKLWARLNIVNRNKTAEDIAQRTLSALCRAAGVMNLQDSTQLHNIPVVADVKVSKDGEQNEIVTYAAAGAQRQAMGFQQQGNSSMAAHGAPSASAVPVSADPSTDAAPQSSSVPPWKRGK